MIAEATLGLVALNLAWSMWMLRILLIEIQNGLGQLDSALAKAIQELVQGGSLGDFEPVNPIQQAIANMLQTRLSQPPPVEVVQRSQDGKFSGPE
jgi:hypothetical protein